MKGFDAKWRDVPHFIIGVTKEIWEDREIASLTHRYREGLVVRSSASVLVGNERIIAATMATLAEFRSGRHVAQDPGPMAPHFHAETGERHSHAHAH